MHRTARVGARNDARVRGLERPIDGRQLAIADLAGELRLDHRERPTGAAAQTGVVEFDQLCESVEQRSHRLVHALDVSEVTRVLDDDRIGRPAQLGQACSVFGDVLVHVVHPGSEGACVLGVEQLVILLERGPHPAELTRIGASPGIEPMTCSAIFRASLCNPAWACRAPQHEPPVPGTAYRTSIASRTRAVERCVPRNQGVHDTPGEQPHVGRRRDAGGMDDGATTEREFGQTEPTRHQLRPLGPREQRRPCEEEPVVPQYTETEALPSGGDALLLCQRGARVFDEVAVRNCRGHAGSQPRHWTHVDMYPTNSSSIGAPRHCTARIASIRPRGDSASSPVARYVGQCGRHSPQATQVFSCSGSSDNDIGDIVGGRCGDRWCATRQLRRRSTVSRSGRAVSSPRAARRRRRRSRS